MSQYIARLQDVPDLATIPLEENQVLYTAAVYANGAYWRSGTISESRDPSTIVRRDSAGRVTATAFYATGQGQNTGLPAGNPQQFVVDHPFYGDGLLVAWDQGQWNYNQITKIVGDQASGTFELWILRFDTWSGWSHEQWFYENNGYVGHIQQDYGTWETRNEGYSFLTSTSVFTIRDVVNPPEYVPASLILHDPDLGDCSITIGSGVMSLNASSVSTSYFSAGDIAVGSLNVGGQAIAESLDTKAVTLSGLIGYYDRQPIGSIVPTWADATSATRRGQVSHSVFNTSTPLPYLTAIARADDTTQVTLGNDPGANTSVYGSLYVSGTTTAFGGLVASTISGSGTGLTNIPQSAVTGLVTSLAGKADDSTVVKLAGTQSISGAKTFTGTVFLSGTDAAPLYQFTASTTNAGTQTVNLGFSTWGVLEFRKPSGTCNIGIQELTCNSINVSLDGWQKLALLSTNTASRGSIALIAGDSGVNRSRNVVLVDANTRWGMQASCTTLNNELDPTLNLYATSAESDWTRFLKLSHDGTDALARVGKGSLVIDAPLQHRGMSTIGSRPQHAVTPSWIDSADATRRARVVHSVYDTIAREYLRADATGTAVRVGVLGPADASYDLTVNGTLRTTALSVAPSSAPASASASGLAGEIRWDANHLYVCVAANSWKRLALSTW